MAAALSAELGAILNTYRRSLTGLTTLSAGASAMVGIFRSLIVLDASTTHSLHPPVITATTDGSSAKVLMLRSDDVESERLSWMRSTSCLSPRLPEALICSIISCRARAYTASTADPEARSAPITTSVLPPPVSSEVQPVSPAANSTETAAAAAERRVKLTAGASSWGLFCRYVVRSGPREHGHVVRPTAPNLANVKVPGQAAVECPRGTTISHSGWNLDGSPSLSRHAEWPPRYSCTSKHRRCRISP
jgi:hypothetical protein